MKAATPFFEAFGGRRVRLLQNVDDPARFIQEIEYDTPEVIELNRQRVASDPRVQAYLRDLALAASRRDRDRRLPGRKLEHMRRRSGRGCRHLTCALFPPRKRALRAAFGSRGRFATRGPAPALRPRACRFRQSRNRGGRDPRSEARHEDAMSKRHEAKYKIDRRMGQNVWGRPKSPVNRREYGPGQHGQRRKGKLSDYGVQLRAKQKLRGYYGEYFRTPVPRHLCGGDPHEGRLRRAYDRPLGAPARRHGLPGEVRADRVRRASVHQPWPRQGERTAASPSRATASRPATSSR